MPQSTRLLNLRSDFHLAQPIYFHTISLKHSSQNSDSTLGAAPFTGGLQLRPHHSGRSPSRATQRGRFRSPPPRRSPHVEGRTPLGSFGEQRDTRWGSAQARAPAPKNRPTNLTFRVWLRRFPPSFSIPGVHLAMHRHGVKTGQGSPAFRTPRRRVTPRRGRTTPAGGGKEGGKEGGARRASPLPPPASERATGPERRALPRALPARGRPLVYPR